MNNVLEIIKKHLNIDEKKEAKYVVELPLNIDNIKDYTKIRITQTYLKTNGNYEMRLRKRSLEGENTYYVTIKKTYDDKEKIITEEAIEKYHQVKDFYYQARQRHYDNVDKSLIPPLNAHLYGDVLVYFNRSISNLVNIVEEITGKDK